MRLLAYLAMTVGSALLLLNLTAWWEPYDYNWASAMLGVGLVVASVIVSGYRKLKDEAHHHFDGEFDEDDRRTPGDFGGRLPK